MDWLGSTRGHAMPRWAAFRSALCAVALASAAAATSYGQQFAPSIAYDLYPRTTAPEPYCASASLTPAASAPVYTGAADTGAALPAVTDVNSMEQRLKALEADWADYKAADTKKAEEDGKPAMRIFGRLHMDYWAFPGDDDPGVLTLEGQPDAVQDRFLFRRARIGVEGDILDNMRYRLEMDFANPNSPEFRDAYIAWEDLPVLQEVRVGNQIRPYGLDSMNGSNYILFMERDLVDDAFNSDLRRLGTCSWSYSESERFNWRYGVFLLESSDHDGDLIGNAMQPELAARLANTAWYDEASGGRGYLHLGIAGNVAWPHGDGIDGPPNQAQFGTRPEARTTFRWYDTELIAGAQRYEIGAVESVLNLGPLQVGGEFMNTWVQRGTAIGPDLRFFGAYLYTYYFLTGEHQPWNRKRGTLDRVQPFENFWVVRTGNDCVRSGWGAWAVGVRWSYLDLNDEEIFGGRGNNVTVGVNWYWNAHARMMFNYIYGRIDDRSSGNSLVSGDFHIIGTRFQVDW